MLKEEKSPRADDFAVSPKAQKSAHDRTFGNGGRDFLENGDEGVDMAIDIPKPRPVVGSRHQKPLLILETGVGGGEKREVPAFGMPSDEVGAFLKGQDLV